MILFVVLPMFALANDKLFAVSTGRSFSFIIDKGRVKAMGRNQFGQLGLGTTEDQKEPVVVPFGDTLVSAVAAGAFHTLFLTEDGEVWVAGRNHHGQLGDSTTATAKLKKLTTVTDVAEVAAGYAHSVFRMRDGSVKAVGLNNVGQLGDDSLTSRLEPVNVPFGNHAADAVVLAQSEASASSQAPTSAATTAAPTPMPMPPPPTPAPTPATQAAAITAGYDFTYILTDAGEVWAMGQNLGGQLGLGISNPKLAATKVDMAGDLIDNMAAGESHGLFVKKFQEGQTGDVCSTGANFAGQLGNNNTERRGTPSCADNKAKAVAAGGDTSCLADWQLSCFGSNRFGQLGLGATAAKFYSSPQQIASVDLADDMAIGGTHCLFLNHDDVVIAGSNAHGELGDGTTEAKSSATVLDTLQRPRRTTTVPPTPAPTPPTPAPSLAPTPAPTPAPTRVGSNQDQDWPRRLVGWLAGGVLGVGVVLVIIVCVWKRLRTRPAPAPADEGAHGPESQSAELAATA